MLMLVAARVFRAGDLFVRQLPARLTVDNASVTDRRSTSLRAGFGGHSENRRCSRGIE